MKITNELAARVRLLPGTALIWLEKLPTTQNGVVLPEQGRKDAELMTALRSGIMLNASARFHYHSKKDKLDAMEGLSVMKSLSDSNSSHVLVSIHADEVDSEYVIVKLGQIVAIIHEDF
jgi:hypothetical protein